MLRLPTRWVVPGLDCWSVVSLHYGLKKCNRLVVHPSFLLCISCLLNRPLVSVSCITCISCLSLSFFSFCIYLLTVTLWASLMVPPGVFSSLWWSALGCFWQVDCVFGCCISVPTYYVTYSVVCVDVADNLIHDKEMGATFSFPCSWCVFRYWMHPTPRGLRHYILRGVVPLRVQYRVFDLARRFWAVKQMSFCRLICR